MFLLALKFPTLTSITTGRWPIVWAYFASTIELAILLRGIKTRNFLRYPFFYTQFACCFLYGQIAYLIWIYAMSHYLYWYWIGQLSTAFIACGNILEILRHAFGTGAQVRFFARCIRRTLAAVVAVFTAVYIHAMWNWPWTRPVHFERNFRTAQSLVLLAVLAGVLYFGLPLSRNVKGIFVGYGTYIGVSLVTLALQSQFPSLWPYRFFLQPLSYDVALGIYLFSLWSYSPPPVPAHPIPPAMRPAFVSRIDPREMWRLTRMKLFKAT